MPQTTPLLTLNKPDGADLVNISHLNSNMDTLDNAVLLNASQTLANKTLTAPTISGSTLTGGNTVTSGGLTISGGGLYVSAGGVGLGVAPDVDAGLRMNGANTTGGIVQFGIEIIPTFTSGATSDNIGIWAGSRGSNSSHTTSRARSIVVAGPIKGTSQTITSSFGMYVNAVTSGGTDNYGVFINEPSGGSGVNAALWITGGEVILGTTIATNATTGFTYICGGAGAPSGTPATASAASAFPLYVDTTNGRLYTRYGGAWHYAALT